VEDDVIGILHLRTLFLLAARTPGATVAEAMVAPVIVADTITVPALWSRLREAGRHSAIVVNEYGSVAGMVTLEDAIEEIFGEMQDEFDQEEEPVITQDDRVSVRGDVLITTLNDSFGLHLPTDEVDTVSGLIWQELGRLPVVGDEVQVDPDGIVLRVESMNRRAVKRVEFTRDGGDR